MNTPQMSFVSLLSKAKKQTKSVLIHTLLNGFLLIIPTNKKKHLAQYFNQYVTFKLYLSILSKALAI